MAVLPVYGRGAWSRMAKDNESKYYEYKIDTPEDGSTPWVNANYLAVNLGVKAIQDRINSYGYSPKLKADGILGPTTTLGIRWVQSKIKTNMDGTPMAVDGQAGPRTCQKLWRDLVTWYCGMYGGSPASQLWGIISLESMMDPGAVGYSTPTDRGLCQINIVAHPDITPQFAHDPWLSIEYTARRFAAARMQFSGKGGTLQRNCSIAQHNAPAWAAQWYRDGVPPNEKIAAYVEKVLIAGAGYR